MEQSRLENTLKVCFTETSVFQRLQLLLTYRPHCYTRLHNTSLKLIIKCTIIQLDTTSERSTGNCFTNFSSLDYLFALSSFIFLIPFPVVHCASSWYLIYCRRTGQISALVTLVLWLSFRSTAAIVNAEQFQNCYFFYGFSPSLAGWHRGVTKIFFPTYPSSAGRHRALLSWSPSTAEDIKVKYNTALRKRE